MTAFQLLLRHAALPCVFAIALSACSEVLDNGKDGGGSSDFDQLYATATFQTCKDCHAPGAAGRTNGTEATQNWSSASAAFSSLKGNASGLIGNFAGCNGVPLVGATSSQSLIVAVLDADVRASFSAPGHPGCIPAAIPDETLPTRAGSVPASVLSDLKSFIDGGGFR